MQQCSILSIFAASEIFQMPDGRGGWFLFCVRPGDFFVSAARAAGLRQPASHSYVTQKSQEKRVVWQVRLLFQDLFFCGR